MCAEGFTADNSWWFERRRSPERAKHCNILLYVIVQHKKSSRLSGNY
ncbi:hypothetical protein C8C94_4917 [Acidovorax sp. 94]|nr:hypothetical protein C8C94_4917 [Acidovorax sp. 94]